jgi:hypothetical protein
MIRFIDLGKQIAVDETDPNWPRQFAFYDTVADRFVAINGWQVFDSFGDFLSEVEQDDEITGEFATRLARLMPGWARMVPAPRNNHVIFGFKG